MFLCPGQLEDLSALGEIGKSGERQAFNRQGLALAACQCCSPVFDIYLKCRWQPKRKSGLWGLYLARLFEHYWCLRTSWCCCPLSFCCPIDAEICWN